VIDVDLISRVPDDYWYDHEVMVVQNQLEQFSPGQWLALERQCSELPSAAQERIAYALGGVDCVASARILFRLCRSSARDTVLTAREALRGLDTQTVSNGARSLSATAEGASTNALLEWVTTAPLPGGS
jgi:hypothetical protein